MSRGTELERRVEGWIDVAGVPRVYLWSGMQFVEVRPRYDLSPGWQGGFRWGDLSPSSQGTAVSILAALWGCDLLAQAYALDFTHHFLVGCGWGTDLGLSERQIADWAVELALRELTRWRQNR